MINTSTGIQQLQACFNHAKIESTAYSDHLVVKSTEKQIREILKQFCPIISENKVSGSYAISMIPYRTPESFCKDSYLTLQEISTLFMKSVFNCGVEVEDRWDNINRFRNLVLPALNKGISEIIEKSAKKDLPIIEIGSGIGYSLSETISIKTVKTQVSSQDCRLLSNSIKDPIYQLDIEGICKAISESGKKVPLFFALNVFDTLTPALRKASFSQLAELQCSGDRILIMLDTNPYCNTILEDLKCLYPENAIFPYFSEELGFSHSVILLPKDKAPFNPSLKEFLACMDMEAQAAYKGGSSELQIELREFQEKFDPIIINLEEFFTQRVQKELEETGYESDVYYHAAFTVGNVGATQDVVYKAVTDLFTVREWSPTDEKFQNRLSKKDLKLPHYGEDSLRCMRMKGQKILGAEILVIEATKK